MDTDQGINNKSIRFKKPMFSTKGQIQYAKNILLNIIKILCLSFLLDNIDSKMIINLRQIRYPFT